MFICETLTNKHVVTLRLKLNQESIIQGFDNSCLRLLHMTS